LEDIRHISTSWQRAFADQNQGSDKWPLKESFAALPVKPAHPTPIMKQCPVDSNTRSDSDLTDSLPDEDDPIDDLLAALNDYQSDIGTDEEYWSDTPMYSQCSFYL
jgi:hypothetical protein